MSKMVAIIEQHSGDNTRNREMVTHSGEFTRIIVVEDGRARVVYEGERFSEEKFRRQIGEDSRIPYCEREGIEI